MLKQNFLLYLFICYFISLLPAQELSKKEIGVSLFLPYNTSNDSEIHISRLRNELDVRQELERVLFELASVQTQRYSKDCSLQFTLSIEVEWDKTERKIGEYDFSIYLNALDVIKSFRGPNGKCMFKVHLLFSPHYLPGYIQKKYKEDLLTDMQGKLIPKNKLNFMPISPASKIWRNECAKWMCAGIEELRPYMGSIISDVMITNEMMYPKDIWASRDRATMHEWSLQYGHFMQYPQGENVEAHSSFETFKKFRGRLLANCLTNLYLCVRAKMDFVELSHIPLGMKLVPWAMHGTIDTKAFGMTDEAIALIFQLKMPIIYIDGYPIHKYDYYRMGQFFPKKYAPKFVISEINNYKRPFRKSEAVEWWKEGQEFGLKSINFFAWNGGGRYSLTPDEKQGVKEVFDSIIVPSELPDIKSLEIKGLSEVPVGTEKSNYQLWVTLDDGSKFSVTSQAEWFISESIGFEITNRKVYRQSYLLRGRFGFKIVKENTVGFISATFEWKGKIHTTKKEVIVLSK